MMGLRIQNYNKAPVTEDITTRCPVCGGHTWGTCYQYMLRRYENREDLVYVPSYVIFLCLKCTRRSRVWDLE